ncbi:JAB domain-containing protein [Alloalcanivorax xenomutans]|jgi:DNA repair protein RadC|uniref:JAB domain-containing protein n=1 Tax=Alloalcanivorax xenomutans TaxID=1094342 RepID=UPI0003B80535|nr:JAB domain-containing protein [Alloalcanivorax xenomutans]ERS15405.1 DNA repair protein RadC [Alcanivorax sp. PN-3]CUR45419.1 DNA repair protein RadC [Alloalcanivorax xenomutans]
MAKDVPSKCEDSVLHRVPCYLSRDELINAASALLLEDLVSQDRLSDPEEAVDFLKLTLAQHPTEHFGVLFLTNKNRVIAYEHLFQGSIDTTTIHPRVIAQRALALNAAAVILAHNHPSGCSQPSTADRTSTRRMTQALELVDVRVLDHLIVTPTEWTSLGRLGFL